MASSKQTVGVEIEDITKYETKYAMELNPKSIGGWGIATLELEGIIRWPPHALIGSSSMASRLDGLTILMCPKKLNGKN